MMAVDLGRAILGHLDRAVRVPAYDPATVTAGIVHLGLGAFHRAHMARYTHDLMQRDPAATRWGIVGAGLMPADRAVRDALAPQDNLYTLVERDGVEEKVSVIGALADVIFAGDSSAALLDVMARPAIRIVSLTVSENGYCLQPATRRLDPAHPLIRADMAQPETPRSAIGVIVEALRRRRDAALPGFAALSCDNIQDNGAVLRAAVLDLAALRDRALADWIAAEARFPCTMVDRITPATRPEHAAHLAQRHGINDRWPVFCESFTQWVIEDHFVGGRPEWEKVGAQFVPDVAPYELMKLRLLNASHLAIAAPGRLLGLTHVHEVMALPLMRGFMAALMERELAPTLRPVPGVDLAAYQRTLVARFANPAIQDRVERINQAAPLNLLLRPIAATLEAGTPVDLLALALAFWMRRALGVDEAGAPIELGHPMAAELRARAAAGRADPAPLLALTALFGTLGEDARLVAPLRRWLGLLYAEGTAATLDRAAAEFGVG
jgi:mannitol-1-phosphate/altronate dehydrogenase